MKTTSTLTMTVTKKTTAIKKMTDTTMMTIKNKENGPYKDN